MRIKLRRDLRRQWGQFAAIVVTIFLGVTLFGASYDAYRNKVCEVYETERQPETLREASAFLSQLTEGKYVRIWTPLGKNQLRIDNTAGQGLLSCLFAAPVPRVGTIF